MKSLEQLKNEILADGIIDSAEVKELETVLFADGKIDEAEASLLFELNNAVSGKANHESWETLFIKAVSSYLLEDETSAGEIDTNEAEWLYDKIKGDGQIDSTEKNLLLHLKSVSKNFPDNLETLLK
ncbi:MAG: TerB family tellurite resistance protein [Flavobacteriales bacterium]|nr:TerB family tellurite resistance protein [Flavobacteriales bacterium]